jgi:hypothetical protein
MWLIILLFNTLCLQIVLYYFNSSCSFTNFSFVTIFLQPSLILLYIHEFVELKGVLIAIHPTHLYDYMLQPEIQ